MKSPSLARRKTLHLAVFTLIGATAAAQTLPVPDNSPDARATRTLKKMTLDERLGLLVGYLTPLIPEAQRPADVTVGVGYVAGVPRLGIPSLSENDAGLGVANQGGMFRKDDYATALPSGPLMASTWDADDAQRAGAIIGAEARAKGYNVLLAGGVNLAREPRNGRTFEYMGEDPLLAGVLGGRLIRGVQSNDIVSTVKHYALNDQETGRGGLSVDMGEAAMRESDLLAFEIAIEVGDPGSVMCAYNRVNGVYACENNFLLNDVLRRDWSYKGFVMTDWGAAHSVAIRQGLDQESGQKLTDKSFMGVKLREALAAGTVTQEDIDQSAQRILRAMYATRVVDHALKAREPIDFEAHGKVTQEIAEHGIVLLKNDGKILPISKQARHILLVGGHSDLGVLGGGGSSQVNPAGGAALALAIAGEPVYHKRMYMPSSPLGSLRGLLPGVTLSYDDGTDPARAAAAARTADLVVVFAEQFAAEGKDLKSLSLPDNQDSLIDAVATANPHTVVVLETCGPVTMPWLIKVPAVLEAWYPGQRGGMALARILTGDVNPSGRLSITFPTGMEQLPNPSLAGRTIASDTTGKDIYDVEFDKHFTVTYPEGADVGYRWYDRKKTTPLFAFGHGLTYTTFTYSKLAIKSGSGLRVTFQVTNSGDRVGSEVAQVYALVCGVRRLVGWSRVELNSRESKTVTVAAEPRLLASFDTKGRHWTIAPGMYSVEVGAAVNEPRLMGKARLTGATIKP